MAYTQYITFLKSKFMTLYIRYHIFLQDNSYECMEKNTERINTRMSILAISGEWDLRKLKCFSYLSETLLFLLQ